MSTQGRRPPRAAFVGKAPLGLGPAGRTVHAEDGAVTLCGKAWRVVEAWTFDPSAPNACAACARKLAAREHAS